MGKKTGLWIGLLVVLAILAWYLLRPEAPSSRSARSGNDAKPAAEVPFTKEGNLWFIQPSGDTIKRIDLEVADNEFETTRGLMDRRSMRDDQGMLFIFPNNQRRSFWMKNTHIPLDIIFVQENMQVESIQKNTVPYSKQSVPSRGPAKYVVEVNAGFCDQYGITDSSFVAYERQ